LGVEETSPDWAIRVEINAKGNIATVTAYQKKLLHSTTPITEHQDGGGIGLEEKNIANKQNQTSAEQKYASSLG
jgi:hypothetical protein